MYLAASFNSALDGDPDYADQNLPVAFGYPEEMIGDLIMRSSRFTGLREKRRHSWRGWIAQRPQDAIAAAKLASLVVRCTSGPC